MIRLETSKKTKVKNQQDADGSWGHLKYMESLASSIPGVRKRSESSSWFNCHGLTFASRRTRVTDSQDILKILDDDKWIEIYMENVLPGDIVLYHDDENGDICHSGIVVGRNNNPTVLTICSKWGFGPEYLHKPHEVPEIYGNDLKYYRCGL